MEKKNYTRPVMVMEMFAPNHFCSACGDGATEVTYYFWCDAGQGNQYKVWLDDGDGRFSQRKDTQLTRSYNPWTGEQGTVYNPCGESHTVTVPEGTSIDNIFPYGWIVRYDYNGLHTNDVTKVRIWRGENNDDIHCTTHLDESSFTPHNPS